MTEKTKKPNATEIKIKAQAEISKGVYSNLALIHHTQNEFIIDFLTKFPGETQLVSRVVQSPQHAKALLNALKENIKKFEEKYGKIQMIKYPIH